MRSLIRYYSTIYILFYTMFIFCFENVEIKNYKKELLRNSLIIMVIFIVFYKGSRVNNNVFVDHFMTSLYSYGIEWPLFNICNGYNIKYCISILLVNCLIALLFIFPIISINNKNVKKIISIPIFSSLILSICLGYYGMHKSYLANQNEISEIRLINDLIDNKSQCMCITNRQGFVEAYNTIDLYINIDAKVIYQDADKLENNIIHSKSHTEISKITFECPFFSKKYTNIKDIKYYIINPKSEFFNIKFNFQAVETINEGKYWCLYRSKNTEFLPFRIV